MALFHLSLALGRPPNPHAISISGLLAVIVKWEAEELHWYLLLCFLIFPGLCTEHKTHSNYCC